ncbi:MAG: hypothetical protein KAJ42_18205, partial [Gemmatimonadetes bacterium]|nr:hypothetical protein [Gemmatimonadota bacterium]
MVLIARTDTLQKGDSFGRFVIRGPGHVPLSRARSGEQSFKLERSHDIGIAAKAILLGEFCVIDLETRRKDYGSDLDLVHCFDIIVVNG